jgi:hypothetical protein
METESSMGMENIAIAVLVGIGVTVLLVWGAWKMMPYMYTLLFPNEKGPAEASDPKKGSATKGSGSSK